MFSCALAIGLGGLFDAANPAVAVSPQGAAKVDPARDTSERGAVGVGDLVVARQDVALRFENKTVDHVQAGQVLRVLAISEDRYWVSRGLPGWVSAKSMIELEHAESFFESRIGRGGDSADYFARGAVRVAVGKAEEGVSDLRKAIEISGDRPGYLEQLGFAQLATREHQSASVTFSKAIQNDPKSASAWMGRGLFHYQAGRHQESYQDFYKAHQLVPDHAFPRKYLGVILHDRGQLVEARTQLEKAVKLDAFDAFSHKALGRLIFEQGDLPEALNEFSIALNLAPSDVEALTGRGVTRHAIGKELSGAAKDFQEALRLLDPAEHEAFLWSNLGQAQFELGDFTNARASLENAIRLDPKFAEARSHLAYLLAVQQPSVSDDLNEAKQHLRVVFAGQDAKTFWDYRALAAVNAAYGDFVRAARFQRLGEDSLKSHGPMRFVEASAETRKIYERKAKG
ncbi:tetratricopeptide repeat protein [Rhodopirellula sp. MGV]|uniref:tetratricopeptide repeat protein n=1 Tax=Rhodopirellula sp. MGV TaxID=2023130 RepID=UPI0013044FA6|nr:tetratricopeptide repeat protein [Rhodopirellula sp. MGV]